MVSTRRPLLDYPAYHGGVCFYGSPQTRQAKAAAILLFIKESSGEEKGADLSKGLTDGFWPLPALRHGLPWAMTRIKRIAGAQRLVLPSHGDCFIGLYQRIDSMVDAQHRLLSELTELLKTLKRVVDVFPCLEPRDWHG